MSAAKLERRIEALEKLYSTPSDHEGRYRLTEERKAAIRLRLQSVIEVEERKGTPKPSDEEIARGTQELRRALRERAGL